MIKPIPLYNKHGNVLACKSYDTAEKTRVK